MGVGGEVSGESWEVDEGLGKAGDDVSVGGGGRTEGVDDGDVDVGCETVEDGEGNLRRLRDGACEDGGACYFHFHVWDMNGMCACLRLCEWKGRSGQVFKGGVYD